VLEKSLASVDEKYDIVADNNQDEGFRLNLWTLTKPTVYKVKDTTVCYWRCRTVRICLRICNGNRAGVERYGTPDWTETKTRWHLAEEKRMRFLVVDWTMLTTNMSVWFHLLRV